jgi:DNA-binding NtrC family response regulator
MNLEDCVILFIEDDKDMILGYSDYFNVEKGLNIKYIRRFDDVRKFLKKLKPCLIIVDDDLNGRSRYDEIAGEIKRALVHPGNQVVFIGCTGEDVDITEMKIKYKKEGYSDFLPNTGSEKDLENMYRVIEKIIKNI